MKQYDKNGYLTKAALTKQIREIVSKEHNLSLDEVLVNWLTDWKITKYPSGLIQKGGKIRLRAPGFKTKQFFVYQEANKKWTMF